jgi:hypothetical protein
MRYGEEDEAIHDSKAWRWIGVMIIGTYLAIATCIMLYTLYVWCGLLALGIAVVIILLLALIFWLYLLFSPI